MLKVEGFETEIGRKDENYKIKPEKYRKEIDDGERWRKKKQTTMNMPKIFKNLLFKPIIFLNSRLHDNDS